MSTNDAHDQGVCKMNTVNEQGPRLGKKKCNYFRMPLHYPRYTKAHYEMMPEWELDSLLADYGLSKVTGDVEYKRRFVMGAFLWPPH